MGMIKSMNRYNVVCLIYNYIKNFVLCTGYFLFQPKYDEYWYSELDNRIGCSACRLVLPWG